MEYDKCSNKDIEEREYAGTEISLAKQQGRHALKKLYLYLVIFEISRMRS